METKWTKGPWCVEDPETDERPGWSWISAVVPGWYGLAEVVTRMDGDTEDSPVGRANANLIAAAPTLYEALEPFGDVDGEGAEDFPDETKVVVTFGRTTFYALTLGDFRRARAALAKAEGE